MLRGRQPYYIMTIVTVMGCFVMVIQVLRVGFAAGLQLSSFLASLSTLRLFVKVRALVKPVVASDRGQFDR